MNMNQIINMVIRVITRKAINSGISAGIGAVSRRKKGNDADQPGAEQDRTGQHQVQGNAGQAKKIARITRRMTRM